MDTMLPSLSLLQLLSSSSITITWAESAAGKHRQRVFFTHRLKQQHLPLWVTSKKKADILFFVFFPSSQQILWGDQNQQRVFESLNTFFWLPYSVCGSREKIKKKFLGGFFRNSSKKCIYWGTIFSCGWIVIWWQQHCVNEIPVLMVHHTVFPAFLWHRGISCFRLWLHRQYVLADSIHSQFGLFMRIKKEKKKNNRIWPDWSF